MQEKWDFEGGETLLFDKPFRWTSTDVVTKVRGLIRYRKVGHAGTLDPLATGLLILCTGKHTKRIEEIQAGEKEYLATIVLGATTPSFDLETEPVPFGDPSLIRADQVTAAAGRLTGTIEQYPPAYSAVKINGTRAYDLARKGREVQTRPRMVQITQFDIEATENPYTWNARIRCGKGTYVRTLAHDLGQILGCGAYLAGLRRIRIGTFHVDDAWTIETFAQQIEKNRCHAGIPGN